MSSYKNIIPTFERACEKTKANRGWPITCRYFSFGQDKGRAKGQGIT